MAGFARIRGTPRRAWKSYMQVDQDGQWSTVNEGEHASRLLAGALDGTLPGLVERARDQLASFGGAANLWPTGYQLWIAFRMLLDARLVAGTQGGMVAFLRLHSAAAGDGPAYRTCRSYMDHAARLIRAEAEPADAVEPWT
jgi:hypothetical protein